MKTNDPPPSDWLRDLDLWQQGLRLLGIDEETLPGRRVGRTAARFASKVGRKGNCLIWLGCCMAPPAGYGRVTIARRTLNTHRVAMAVAAGLDPKGFVVRHRCDNPPCVNPDHLEIGTQLDNVADRDDRGRTARGERSGVAKLTAAQVAEIRAGLVVGETYSVLAARYGVHKASIARINTGQTWRHVA